MAAYREPASRVEEVPVKWTARVKWHRVAMASLWLAGLVWCIAADAGYSLGEAFGAFCGVSMFFAVAVVLWWNINEYSWDRW